PKTGPQAQEEHPAALVAPQRLHGRVVDDLHGAPEGGAIVEADPTLAEVVRLCHGPPVEHGARIAERHRVIVPPASELLGARDHCGGRQRRPRVDPPWWLTLSGGENLDAGPADVHGQYL